MSRTYRKSFWIFEEDFNSWIKHQKRWVGHKIRGMEGVAYAKDLFEKKNREKHFEPVRANVKEELRKNMRAQSKVAIHREIVDGKEDVVYPTKKIHCSDIWNWD